CHHWVAPSWGVGIVAVKRFYHASPAPSTPHRLSPGHSHPPHFPLSYWDFRRLNKCKFLLCCRCCQALLRLFLPCLLGALCHRPPPKTFNLIQPTFCAAQLP